VDRGSRVLPPSAQIHVQSGVNSMVFRGLHETILQPFSTAIFDYRT
jgi:hypothetical protein